MSQLGGSQKQEVRFLHKNRQMMFMNEKAKDYWNTAFCSIPENKFPTWVEGKDHEAKVYFKVWRDWTGYGKTLFPAKKCSFAGGGAHTVEEFSNKMQLSLCAQKNILFFFLPIFSQLASEILYLLWLNIENPEWMWKAVFQLLKKYAIFIFFPVRFGLFVVISHLCGSLVSK